MRAPTVRTATRNRRTIRRRLAGALAVALALGGVALARARVRTHPPAIRLSAPQSVAAGSKYTLKASGYFNNTKRHDGTAGANFASVAETNRFVSCNYKTLRERRLGWTYLAGGVQEKMWRARRPTTPQHFSVTARVAAPVYGGHYTLCASLGNYPTGRLFKPTAGAHMTVRGAHEPVLTISFAGSGSGKVTGGAASGDLDCHASCSHRFDKGNAVDLTAQAAKGSAFVGWGGACAYEDNPSPSEFCGVTMHGDTTVTVTFKKRQASSRHDQVSRFEP